MWEERKRMAFTPLVVFDKIPSALILFKNESASATESLKHRYSWALVMWGLLQGYIHPRSTVYEASSGNTARSEAYMCSLIGVKFITVLPDTTELLKVQKIEQAGGQVEKIPFGNTLGKAKAMAEEDPDGFYINQFGNSGLALEYHESGTISSVGRFTKKYGMDTEIVLADTQFSAYYDLLVSGRFRNGTEDPQPLWVPPGMAGTGFGWAGPIIQGQTSSLISEVIDRTLKIPDLASVAAMHILHDKYGIEGGPSTGVNFAAALKMIGTEGNKTKNVSPLVLATLIADNGANYRSTYYNDTWLDKSFARHGGLIKISCWQNILEQFIKDAIAQNENSFTDPIEFGAAKCGVEMKMKSAKK